MSRRRQVREPDGLSSDDDNSSMSSSSSNEFSNDDISNSHDRELSNEEMEKLIQLQDLTGMEDLQICRALLESKDWDLEATAREHLNLPSSPPPPLLNPDPRPLVEAPNARSIMRPAGSNHVQQNSNNRNYVHPRNGRGTLVPQGHTIFSWAMYLLTMPFRLTYRTVFGVFDLALSIFGLSGTANLGTYLIFLSKKIVKLRIVKILQFEV